MRQDTVGRRTRRQTAPSKTQEVDDAAELSDDSTSVADISNELEFTKWFNEVEDDLLEVSYDEYQYDAVSKYFNDRLTEWVVIQVLSR